MNGLDASIVMFLNGYAGHSAAFDRFVLLVADNDLLKGGLFIGLLWFFWFAEPRRGAARPSREYVLATLGGSFAALFLARMLALALPFRMRPFQSLTPFVIPEASVRSLEGWSAFPSDHAALFFALAAGLFLLSRPVGLLAAVYAVVVVLLPRMYLGLHAPSDIVAGALIGVVGVAMAAASPLRSAVARPVVRWSDAHPAAFYGGAFLLTFEVATLFDSVRALGRFTFHWAKLAVRQHVPPSPLELAALGALLAVLAGVALMLTLTQRHAASGRTSRPKAT